MTFWQLIFIQSKINGGIYDESTAHAELEVAQRDLVSNSVA
jgi:hypothetical protein